MNFRGQREAHLSVEYDKDELMNLDGSIARLRTPEPRESWRRSSRRRSTTSRSGSTWTRRRRAYGFEIPNILRQKDEQTLTLQWDGAPLGIDRQGKRRASRIPALDEFAVTQADATEVNDQRQIQVHFSDCASTRART